MCRMRTTQSASLSKKTYLCTRQTRSTKHGHLGTNEIILVAAAVMNKDSTVDSDVPVRRGPGISSHSLEVERRNRTAPSRPVSYLQGNTDRESTSSYD